MPIGAHSMCTMVKRIDYIWQIKVLFSSKRLHGATSLLLKISGKWALVFLNLFPFLIIKGLIRFLMQLESEL